MYIYIYTVYNVREHESEFFRHLPMCSYRIYVYIHIYEYICKYIFTYMYVYIHVCEHENYMAKEAYYMAKEAYYVYVCIYTCI